MQTTVHMIVWGPQDGSALANEAGWQEQEALVSGSIQHALARHTPAARIERARVAQDCRLRGGERRAGYAITVALAVGARPTTHAAIRALECQMESQICVALLNLLRSIEVEAIEVIEAQTEAGADIISA